MNIVNPKCNPVNGEPHTKHGEKCITKKEVTLLWTDANIELPFSAFTIETYIIFEKLYIYIQY